MQGPGLFSKGAQLRRVHLPQAVVLTVEHVQAQAGQFMAVGEVEQVERGDAPVGEVGQQRVGVGKQPRLVEAFKQAAGQLAGQQWRLGTLGIVVQ
ncbi:hypothetical protein D9M71_684450 [compost metagenome]